MTHYVWSHSGLQQFETCPLQFYAEKITKEIPYEQNAGAKRGEEEHKNAAGFLVSGEPPTHSTIPDFVTRIKAVLQYARGVYAVEQEWAIREDGSLGEWFDKTLWARVKIDFFAVNGTTAYVVDWKTEGSKGCNIVKHTKQLDRYAVAVFHISPAVQTVRATLACLDHNESVTLPYTRAMYPKLLAEVTHEAAAIQAALDMGASAFPPKPNPFCSHCKLTRCHYATQKVR